MRITEKNRKLDILLLAAWTIALVGYFGPWIDHRSAALAWNAYDLFDILRFLPEIESFTIEVNLQSLRLPLVGLGVLLPLLLGTSGPGWRWGAAIIGAALAISTLPPYPQILNAWRTPGWRVPFWWGVGGTGGAVLVAGLGPHLEGLRLWLVIAGSALTSGPAIVTFWKLLPPLRRLYQAPIQPGWGFWSWGIGILLLVIVALVKALTSWQSEEQPEMHAEGDAEEDSLQRQLSHARAVKKQNEAWLMRKANVVSVGIQVEDKEESTEEREVQIVVNVTHKVSSEDLRPEDRIPEDLEGVPVKVQPIGTLKAQ
ncbi:MAG: hypothetical protein ACP5GX_08090 [Anaerolineae bacterium]